MTIKKLSDPEYLRVILNDQTAKPLLSKLQTLISIYWKDLPDKIKILEKMFNYTSIIIERRNEVIHGSIFYISQKKAFLFKDKTNKSGLNPIEEYIDASLLLKQTEKVIKTKEMFEMLNSYLNQNDDNLFDYFFRKEKIDALNINSK